MKRIKLFVGLKSLTAFRFSIIKQLLFFCTISFCISLNAQVEEYTFKKVNIEVDGETVFDVYEITQDHQGYMWMRTNLGLIRYDGIEGKKYFSDSSSNDSISALYVDSQGDIWIGSQSGLSKYNPDCDCFHHYPSVIDDITLISVRSITEDKNNNIWFSIRNGGIFQYERESDSITRFLHKSSDSFTKINVLLVDQFNNLWIGTGAGLLRYNIDTGNIKKFVYDPSDPSGLFSNRIIALYEDKQGKIFIGTHMSGFHFYDPKSGTLNRINYDDKNPNQIHATYSEELVLGIDPAVNLIHQDHNGDYWIGTTGKGLNHFNIKAKTFNNYNFNFVNPQFLESIYEDRQGSLWVGGSWGSGLFRTNLFAPKYHLNTNLAHAELTYESSIHPGVLWVGYNEKGFSKFNTETKKITTYVYNIDDINGIEHDWVRSVYQENKKTLWLGLGAGGAYGGHDGFGGVDKMDIETEVFTHFRITRNDDGRGDFTYTVFSICEDNEGYLWAGAGPGGIFRSDKDKKEFKHFKILKNDNSSKEVFFNIVRKDSNGDIWASDFAGNGTLYLYNHQENKFNPYLKGFKMHNLLIDDKGWLLISTWKKGLVHLNTKDKSFVQYTKKEGLPSNNGVDIVKGENGIYWIGTSMGPAKLDTKTGEISSIGLPKSRYNRGIFKASIGQIYLGTNNGLVSFYPDQRMGNPYPPQINISELLIAEENYLANKNESGKLNLSYKQNDISFKYVGLHFGNPKKNSYQYKLDPLDDKWIDAGYERTVRFANLSPGTYNFQVKASNSDGVWSEIPESVTFTIKPAWWATWWAYAIYTIMLAFMTHRIYRFQLSRKMAASESRRLKEVNELKNTLFANITHEFRTPLTVIKGMTESIKSNLKNKKLDDLENSLEMIERNSDGLLYLVNEMLDLAKIESGNMNLDLVQSDVIPFLKYLGESFSSMAEENQVNLIISVEIDSLIMDFDAKKLAIIISNLLSNALKFTPEFGKIIVHINQIKRKGNVYLNIKITDNGIGIPPKKLAHIFNRFYQADSSIIRKNEGTGIGLSLVKELVELMNGSIKVKSTLDKGSEFRIMIPVSKEAPLLKNVQLGKLPHPSVPNKISKHAKQNLETNSELPLVLIVEDNMDVAHYLKTCLLNKYETMHAENGIVGIEMALEKIPDIIICDIMMPGKDGFEVCATLKSDERTDHIPIIILTAKVTIEDRLTGLSHGADAYLAKPFNKNELFTRLDQLVLLRKKLIGKFQKEGYKKVLSEHTKDPKLLFLQKIIELIQEQMENPAFGSVDLAKKLLISDSQIYRKIKAITGKSTAVYIRSIRLQYAKDLLKSSDRTISEVAYQVGFKDPAWFSRAFKDEFGSAPSNLDK